MKRSLHPGAIAAFVIVFAVAIGTLVAQMSRDPAGKSPAASPYTKVGERPTSPGSGVNSITGEPLSQTAKDHTAATFAEHNRR